MLGRWNVFGHRPANPCDGIANLASDALVRVDCLGFGAYALARHLVARLRHAELVGGKFGGVHPVHQAVTRRNVLYRLDRVLTAPGVHPFVSGIVEHAEHAVLHTRLSRSARQRLELLAGLPPQLDALGVGGMLVG